MGRDLMHAAIRASARRFAQTHIAPHGADWEENEEFPTIQSKRSDGERKELGDEFLSQFEAAGGKALASMIVR